MRVSRKGSEYEFTVTPLDPPDGSAPTIERQQPTLLASPDAKTGIGLGR
jgi:hypothetical protein